MGVVVIEYINILNKYIKNGEISKNDLKLFEVSIAITKLNPIKEQLFVNESGQLDSRGVL